MRPGGSLNARVVQNDLSEIQSGQFYSASLLRLPLIPGFRSGKSAAEVIANTTPWGGRPDRRTDNTQNPIVGNVAEGEQIIPTRIQLQQPCNSIQLVWHALNQAGNYETSYPINSDNNVLVEDWPLTAQAPGEISHWAYGWLRLNGQGIWFPMSLMPSTEWKQTAAGDSFLAALPFGGFTSINAPMSFIDWVGYWDGAGSIDRGPDGAGAHILAIASANLSLSSANASIGSMTNYATPTGSGPEPGGADADTQRNQDRLTRGNYGR